MPSYFRQVPDLLYVNTTEDGRSISDYSRVKNLFKRGKLRDDIFGNLSFFTKYQIIGDERPDNVAYKVYGDETLDWLILISNNIINVQTEWPLTQQGFYNYLIDKYGNEETLYNIRHYECTGVKNSLGATIAKEGLIVPQNFSISYFDSTLGQTITQSNITKAITNFEYENNIQNDKRNIFVLKQSYINVVLNDMEQIMTYKKGSTQYVNATLKRGDNIRLFE